MTSFAFYTVAAVAEIGGCFAFWAWLRLDQIVLWTVPGVMLFVVFALSLTRTLESPVGLTLRTVAYISLRLSCGFGSWKV